MTLMQCNLCDTIAKCTNVKRPENWQILKTHAWIGKKVRYVAAHICPACQGKPIRDLSRLFKQIIAELKEEEA